jgi:hypothetical protein
MTQPNVAPPSKYGVRRRGAALALTPKVSRLTFEVDRAGLVPFLNDQHEARGDHSPCYHKSIPHLSFC